MEETLNLGGNIQLNGFNDVGKAEMVVIKKIVGNYAKEISEKISDFKELKVTLQNLSEEKIIKVSVSADKELTSEEKGKNLFMVMDFAFKKIMSEI